MKLPKYSLVIFTILMILPNSSSGDLQDQLHYNIDAHNPNKCFNIHVGDYFSYNLTQYKYSIENNISGNFITIEPQLSMVNNFLITGLPNNGSQSGAGNRILVDPELSLNKDIHSQNLNSPGSSHFVYTDWEAWTNLYNNLTIYNVQNQNEYFDTDPQGFTEVFHDPISKTFNIYHISYYADKDKEIVTGLVEFIDSRQFNASSGVMLKREGIRFTLEDKLNPLNHYLRLTEVLNIANQSKGSPVCILELETNVSSSSNDDSPFMIMFPLISTFIVIGKNKRSRRFNSNPSQLKINSNKPE